MRLSAAALIFCGISLLAGGCTGSSKSSNAIQSDAAVATGNGSKPIVPPVAVADSPRTTVQFKSVGYTANQADGAAIIAVTRSLGAANSVTVNYNLVEGTAVSGTDFVGTQGTITWLPGDSPSKTFIVPLDTSTMFAGTKEFSVRLSTSASNTTILKSPSLATVIIIGAQTSGPIGNSGNAVPKSIKNWAKCDALTDQSVQVAAAFQAAHAEGFALIVDCSIRLHIGSPDARAVQVEDDTTVIFQGDGEFIVANTVPSAFEILHPSEVTLIKWTVNYL